MITLCFVNKYATLVKNNKLTHLEVIDCGGKIMVTIGKLIRNKVIFLCPSLLGQP